MELVAFTTSFKSCPRVGGIRGRGLLDSLCGRFQVVPPCGGHLSVQDGSVLACQFQVVPPCGGHPGLPGFCCLWYPRFKSCPRVGGIRHAGQTAYRRCVSSRAPVWGASSNRIYRFRIKDVSSRAPVWGASNSARYLLHDGVVSSRAPVWGASGIDFKAQMVEEFQVVPPCGGHLWLLPRR